MRSQVLSVGTTNFIGREMTMRELARERMGDCISAEKYMQLRIGG